MDKCCKEIIATIAGKTGMGSLWYVRQQSVDYTARGNCRGFADQARFRVDFSRHLETDRENLAAIRKTPSQFRSETTESWKTNRKG